jgi:HPt (histidine-containing phosphotransfer) domain-containing protein
MDSHISKPIDPDAMFETMRQFYRPALRASVSGPTALTGGKPPLTAIDGVDVEGALRRLAGNTKLYWSLLARFVNDQEGCAHEIGAAMERGDPALAEMIAHKLNGIAGNLGVETVHAAAAELEKRLREKDTPDALSEAHARLDVRLAAAVGAIRAALPHEDSAPPGGGVPVHPAGLRRADLQRLARLIEESDSEAVEMFASIRDALQASVGSVATNTIGASLSSYDFAAALLQWKAMERSLGAGGKGGGDDDAGK